MRGKSIRRIKRMSTEDNRVNPYPIRLTPELKERLQASAKANGRSLHAEMMLRLEASFTEPESPKTENDLTEARIREIVREELTKSQ